MFPHQQSSQGQLPTHWQPPTSQHPANGSYINTTLPPPPPPPPQEPRPDMQHAQYQQPYRLPGPNEWTRGPPSADAYRQQSSSAAVVVAQSQSQSQQPQYVQQHLQPPAPRQRTAIACRYCRRRKIRCSGFEATEDGRCSNCMRFNQDCIFTPVSAQTQAFVPAHTVWRGVGQPPPLFGAYGQPLPTGQHEPYLPQGRQQHQHQPHQQHQQHQHQHQQQYLPSPTAGPYPVHSDFGLPAAPPEEASRDAPKDRKRPHPEPHTATLPPPNPGTASQAPLRSSGRDYPPPDPHSLTPASCAATPYYAAQPPRPLSPPGGYRYEGSRSSSSPQSQAPTTPAPPPYYHQPSQSSSVLSSQPPPPPNDAPTPPPASQSSTRPSMRINDLMSDGGNLRTSTDSDMLNMLNRRPM